MVTQVTAPIYTPPGDHALAADGTRTGGQLVCESLLAQGVHVLFGYPGGAALPLYRDLARYPALRHVLIRHEQNAAHAADGYARASGRPGVCLSTSGPGATNLLTGLATAYMDCVPLVALTGQVARAMIGTQAFQEVDIVRMAAPVTKAAYQVQSVEQVPIVLAEAFALARAGRPGPVLVDLPKDVLAGRSAGPASVLPPTAAAPAALDANALLSVTRVAELLARAKRPVLLAGHGVLLANAFAELRALAERAALPTATTLLGLSAFPESHPLALGLVGMHGRVAANLALHAADLVIGVGCRFDDRVVGRAKDFAPHATVVHVDLDPAAFGRSCRADLPVLADARAFLAALAPLVGPLDMAARAEWSARLHRWESDHADCHLSANPAADDLPDSPGVVQAIRRVSAPDALVVADVGQHQMWAGLHYGYEAPHSYLTTGGLGTMGYALPAALGAQTARPEREVWALAGDGGFQMSAPELSTLAAEGIGVKLVVFNNQCLGMVRQWQERFYDHVYSHSLLPQPSFVALAQAHGLPARRVARRADLDATLRWAAATPGPVLIEVRLPVEETVYPMVPPGASLGEMVCADPIGGVES